MSVVKSNTAANSTKCSVLQYRNDIHLTQRKKIANHHNGTIGDGSSPEMIQFTYKQIELVELILDKNESSIKTIKVSISLILKYRMY